MPEAGQDARSWPPAFLAALEDRSLLQAEWCADASVDVTGLAAATRAWVEARIPRGGRVHLVGQGLGALVALELALGRRKLAASVVAIGAHPGARTAVVPPPWVATALAEALAADGEDQAAALRPLLHARDFTGARVPWLAAEMVRRQWAIAGTANSYGRLPRIDAPCLFLHGSADLLVLPENGRTLAGRVPGAAFRLVGGAGHALVQERPALSGAWVRDFSDAAG